MNDSDLFPPWRFLLVWWVKQQIPTAPFLKNEHHYQNLN
jgi:hypothetical protein